VTDVYLLPLISLAGKPDGQLSTGHTAMATGQPSGSLTVALTNHPDVPRRAYQVAGPPGLPAPAKLEAGKGSLRVSWRRDG
jgi:hypothetical protein